MGGAVNRDDYWDVTNRAGIPTGDIYRRGAPDWPNGGFHIVVATCAVRPDGTVLLTKRSASKNFPLSWEFPGGSALAGESSRAAAMRELYEETSVAVQAEKLILVGRYAETTALLDFYVAHLSEDPVIALDPAEVAAYEWVALDVVEQRLANDEMAGPLSARLEELWQPLVKASDPAEVEVKFTQWSGR